MILICPNCKKKHISSLGKTFVKCPCGGTARQQVPILNDDKSEKKRNHIDQNVPEKAPPSRVKSRKISD